MYFCTVKNCSNHRTTVFVAEKESFIPLNLPIATPLNLPTAHPSKSPQMGRLGKSDEDIVFRGRDVLFEKYFWMSPYAYCANNPMRYVDPTGLGPEDRVKAARGMTGTAYRQEEGSMRTANTPAAKQYMDCSEFVCRVLMADGVINTNQSFSSATLKEYFEKGGFTHSETAQVGDVAVWKGHVGIVTAVDKNGKFKLVHARGKDKLSMENSAYTTPDVYRPGAEFYGFYRPTNESPDGKLDGNGTVEPSIYDMQIPEYKPAYFNARQPTFREKVQDMFRSFGEALGF